MWQSYPVTLQQDHECGAVRDDRDCCDHPALNTRRKSDAGSEQRCGDRGDRKEIATLHALDAIAAHDAQTNALVALVAEGQSIWLEFISRELVRGGQVIGRGRNRRVQKGDPMAHAEIDCLTNAGRQTTYKDTVLYSTLMPCHLCSGAVLQFGIPRVVVGESVNFGGAPDLLRKNGVELVDLHDAECVKMMAEFIKAHPALWNEDIGK